MTYKLDPSISKISSPVVLIFPNGTGREYGNGVAVVEDHFEENISDYE